MNRVIDTDPQIVKVPMDHAEFGARKSAQPKNLQNEMALQHVKNQG
jgi:hypothetical protein